MTTQWAFDAVVNRVVDGDTVIFDLSRLFDFGFRIYVTSSSTQRIRLARINCPEAQTPEGEAATQFTKDWLASHTELKVTTSRQDNYGRWIGEVLGGVANLSDDLLAAGHAVAYT